MGPNSHPQTKLVIPVGLLLLALAPPFSGAAPECSVEFDTVDTDGDRLSDCLERVSLGTQPALPDSDADGLIDSRDLLPGAATDFTLTASIVELVDMGGRCDTGWYKTQAHKWWDPYVSHAYLAINTINGGQDAVFLNANMKKGDWADEQHINPVDLSAVLVLPTDIHAYLKLDPGVPPLMAFRFGLLDYDPESKDEHIRLRAGSDIVGDVPISLGPQGSHALMEWKDESNGCAGRVVLAIDTPIQWETAVAAVLAKTQSLVTYDQIRQARIHAPYVAHTAASPSLGLGVHEAAEIAAETVLLRGLNLPGVVLQKGIDINSLPDTRHPEHPLNRLYDRDLYGQPLEDATGDVVEDWSSLLLCVPDAENAALREGCAIPSGDDLPPPGIDPAWIQGMLEQCGLYRQAQAPAGVDCKALIDLALGVPDVAMEAVQQVLEGCGLSVSLQAPQQDGVDCQAVLDAIDKLPGTAIGVVKSLLQDCGIATANANSACQQVTRLVDDASNDLMRSVAQLLADCGSQLSVLTVLSAGPCETVVHEAEGAVDLAVDLAQDVIDSCSTSALATHTDLAGCKTVFTLVEALPGVIIRVVRDALEGCPRTKADVPVPTLDCERLVEIQSAWQGALTQAALPSLLHDCGAAGAPETARACFDAVQAVGSSQFGVPSDECGQVVPSLLRKAGSPLQGQAIEALALAFNQTGAVVSSTAVRIGADEIGQTSLASWAPLPACIGAVELRLVVATPDQSFVASVPLPVVPTPGGRASEAILAIESDGAAGLTAGWVSPDAVAGLLELVTG